MRLIDLVLFYDTQIRTCGGVLRELISAMQTSMSSQLPELPSILGSRRSNTAPSPDISEPLDLLIKGEARKKSPTQVSLEDIEEPPVVPVEEVDLFHSTLVLFAYFRSQII